MENKKGTETTIGTIVVVILAVLVLIVVITGFSIGWNELWSRLNIFTPAAQSIDAVVAKCEYLCLTNQKYSYCCDKQKIKINNVEIEKDCNELKKTESLLIKCKTITDNDCNEITCRTS